MFCEKCGTQMADTEVFCPNCGAKQSAVSAASENAVVSPSASGNKLYDILVFVAIGIMAIGAFLPVASVSMYGITQSASFIEGAQGVGSNGIFVVIAAAAAFALYYFNKEKFMAIPAGVTAVLLIAFAFKVSEVSSAAEMASSGFGMGITMDIDVSLGFGYWVMWIGAIATAVLPFTPLAQTRSIYFKNIFKA